MIAQLCKKREEHIELKNAQPFITLKQKPRAPLLAYKRIEQRRSDTTTAIGKEKKIERGKMRRAPHPCSPIPVALVAHTNAQSINPHKYTAHKSYTHCTMP